ncbi:RsmE family RNA methyltransferase [Entomospira entomophila]|uniref:Ribosomal RNA small subunit methyltransferase E n=1 Tax=Entomospira entomophila TaxID=2719988 RepID=A0A968GB53_9SPIO|nr:RsmE family RNA methyltransferase [Entomospira entomophilus]NIZ41140.1 RsmE family RNA methyltransferase [Entomospira entomophilus]WDI35347.1 RsmE family RNA methyltransferase [Entomospira entomophilus]
MNLILITQSELSDDNQFIFHHQDERFTHILKILKLSTGDTFKVGIIRSSFGRATIISLSNTQLIAQYHVISSNINQNYPIHLFLGAVRPLVMRRLLKDISSMGVTTLSLFSSDKGERSYLDSSLWRDNQFEKHVMEGLSQAVSINPPIIHRYHSLSEALSAPSILPSHRYILDPYAKKTWKDEFILSKQLVNVNSISLIIGSERGFSDQEMTIAQQRDFLPISITSRILRTETATIATLTLASQLF